MDQKMESDKRKLSIAIILFILLILIVSPLKEKIESIVGFKGKELKHLVNIDLKLEESLKVNPYKKQVIVSNKDSITSYNYNKEKEWKRNIDNTDNTYLGETGLFINNQNNNSITKLDLNGDELWSYKINYPAYTMTEIQGDLFVYFKVDKNHRGIAVIDKDGELVLNKEKSKEEILSSNISDDKKRIIITGMDNSSQELKSKLTYLKSNGEIIWTKDIEKKMIYNVLFLGDKKLLLIGDKELICKNNQGETLWQKEIDYNLRDIEVVNEKEIYVLYGTDDSNIEILNDEGKVEYKKNFKKEFYDIGESEEDTLLIGNEGIIGLRDKKITMKHDIHGEPKDVNIIGEYIVILRESKAEVFQIVNKGDK